MRTVLVNPTTNQFCYRGTSVRARPLIVELALYLGRCGAGHVIPKEEIARHVWPRKLVSDECVLQAISELRKQLRALGLEAPLRTIRKRGLLLEAGHRITAMADGASCPKTPEGRLPEGVTSCPCNRYVIDPALERRAQDLEATVQPLGQPFFQLA
jgi:DNA-binding winged helix-turn-helix (wHTH) protein